MLPEVSSNSADWGMFVDNFKKKGLPVTPFVIDSVKNIHGTPGGIAEVGYLFILHFLKERTSLCLGVGDFTLVTLSWVRRIN